MSANANYSIYAVMGAAVIGIVGAAGMFIYEKVLADKRRHVLSREVARLDEQVSSMQLELQTLKDLQKEKSNTRKNKPIRKLKKSPLNAIRDSNNVDTASIADSTYTTDNDYYNSALGTDADNSSEEFYDLSSDTETETIGIAQVLSKVDELTETGAENDVRIAQTLLKESLRTYEDNPQLQWRLGKVYYKIFSFSDDDSEKKREIINKGITHCQKALDLDDKDAEIHKWYAILIGSRSDFSGTKERIQDGFVFKRHIDIAIALNPLDPFLYYLLGRFKYEVAGLTWLERKLAASLFAEPPMATYAEAILDCLRAQDLALDLTKDNRLLLAKCYIGEGDYEKALEYLKLAKDTPGNPTMDGEIQLLLNKYISYNKE